MTLQDNSQLNSESEISFLEIVKVIQESWIKLVAASVVGAILGLSGWFFLGGYSAEYILLNKTNANTSSYGLDLLSWKIIQKSLPNLAAQIVENDKAPEGQTALYRTLAHDQWWQKNTIPNYAILKADTKDLASISKEFDGASTQILSLTISAEGSSEKSAINAVIAASQFLRSGGAYLQIRSILEGYDGEVISTEGEIRGKIASTKIEMGYQQQRAKSLEELYKRYPSNSSAAQQVLDPGGSGAKYLSITTQIIAANNVINQSKQELNRLEDRLTQIALLKSFLDEALPKFEKNYDGLVLYKELLVTEAKMRDKIGADDLKQQETLDQIRLQLQLIGARFTKGLEANTVPTSRSKKGMIKNIAAGFVGGFFLVLILLLGQRAWPIIKTGSAN